MPLQTLLVSLDLGDYAYLL